jgi:SMODS-associated and fused to various effectors sensor domain
MGLPLGWLAETGVARHSVSKEITRYIKPDVQRELWARSAGRCEFDGCNALLFRSSVTQERVNVGEQAHIYSFSQDGPRGWGRFITNRAALNEIHNLMLVCHGCHKTIDQDKQGVRYSVELLRQWKTGHERRIEIVTGIAANKKSHVILYGANIGRYQSDLQLAPAVEAMFPDWYPATERAEELSMSWYGRDHDSAYWATEAANLAAMFSQKIEPLLLRPDRRHFSVFALAPMPLLMKLGALMSDQTDAEVYQLHREPRTWKWLDGPDDFEFRLRRPGTTDHNPALVISLSDTIAADRIPSTSDKPYSIWELTIAQPSNDFLKSRDQLSRYRRAVRQILDEIGGVHGKATPIEIFPAMPVSCAVELGRVRMPKADSDWVVYDYSNNRQAFVHALTLGAAQ